MIANRRFPDSFEPEPPKRILMTADPMGGVWTYALQLAEALSAHGIEVLLATLGAPISEAQREQADLITNLVLFESGYKLEWMENPWEDVVQSGKWLLKLERQLQPDLVHLNGYAHGALPWQSPTLVTGHSCVLSWWQAVHGKSAPRTCARYRQAVRQGIWSANYLVAPSRAMLAELDCYYGPLPPHRVIPHGRSLDHFPPAPKEPFVLSAGRLWDEAKNISALERIAPELEWPVYAAGPEPHPEGGRVEAGHLQFLGALSSGELASWYGRAAIYALPARYEPFGWSVLEAALAGCALVLGDIPSLRENWEGAARFVPPDDSPALLAAINQLIADPAQRTALAAQSRRRALELNPARMAEGYLEVYSELRGAPSRSRTEERAVCAA
jgi:glycogen synthase